MNFIIQKNLEKSFFRVHKCIFQWLTNALRIKFKLPCRAYIFNNWLLLSSLNSSPISNYWRLTECAMLSHASLLWTCYHCLKFLSSLCLLANSHFRYQVFCKTFSRECSKNSLCALFNTICHAILQMILDVFSFYRDC